MQRDNGTKTGKDAGYATLFRGYDTEDGRWNQIDPKWRELPSESPYCGMGNNPVMNTDALGMEPLPRDERKELKDVMTPEETKRIREVGAKILKYTDINDMWILGTAIMGNPRHITGESADYYDVEGAKMSIFIPVVPSSGLRKLEKAVNEGSEEIGNSAKVFTGSKGKIDHQEAVKKAVDDATKEFPNMKIFQEKKIKLEGSNRRPDVQVVDPNTDKTIKIYEAERNPNFKRHQDRLKEYDKLNVPHTTIKVGK